MKRILAVDDDQDTRFTLQAIGEVANWAMEAVESGEKALKMLKENQFDLVMVDYHMPAMNGLTLVQKIREFLPELPVLVLTVDESMELARKFLDAGATDFAIKPIRTADLISRVKLHLELSELKHPGEVAADLDSFDLPKGMSVGTLKVVLDYLRTLAVPETLVEISAGTGLAYQTVHRYMDYLVQEGGVSVEMNYGKVGRPVQRYLLVRGS